MAILAEQSFNGFKLATEMSVGCRKDGQHVQYADKDNKMNMNYPD
jgi:hypothetical protein